MRPDARSNRARTLAIDREPLNPPKSPLSIQDRRDTAAKLRFAANRTRAPSTHTPPQGPPAWRGMRTKGRGRAKRRTSSPTASVCLVRNRWQRKRDGSTGCTGPMRSEDTIPFRVVSGQSVGGHEFHQTQAVGVRRILAGENSRHVLAEVEVEELADRGRANDVGHLK